MNEMQPVDSRAAPVPMPSAPPPMRASAPRTALKIAARRTAVRSIPMLLYQLNRMGRSGVAGVGLILAAGIFVFAAVLPQYREISSLREEIGAARLAGPVDQSPPMRLGRFLDTLPKRGELPSIAGKIFSLAATAGVTLDQGRYELTPLHSGQLARYRMSFPIKGPYPSIRRFIDATLSTVPAAALEGMRIERKAAGDSNVDADLRFSIFVRNET